MNLRDVMVTLNAHHCTLYGFGIPGEGETALAEALLCHSESLKTLSRKHLSACYLRNGAGCQAAKNRRVRARTLASRVI